MNWLKSLRRLAARPETLDEITWRLEHDEIVD